jgi:hypothetical protein
MGVSQFSWLMTVKQRLVFNSLGFIHRIKCGVLPNYFGSKLVYSQQVHDYPLRNVNRFRLPRCQGVISQCRKTTYFTKDNKSMRRQVQILKTSKTLENFKNFAKHMLKKIFDLKVLC